MHDVLHSLDWQHKMRETNSCFDLLLNRIFIVRWGYTDDS